MNRTAQPRPSTAEPTNTRPTAVRRPSQTAQAPLLLRPTEAAEALAIGRTRLYELIRNGELESVLIGRSRRIKREALAAYVAGLRHGDIEL